MKSYCSCCKLQGHPQHKYPQINRENIQKYISKKMLHAQSTGGYKGGASAWYKVTPRADFLRYNILQPVFWSPSTLECKHCTFSNACECLTNVTVHCSKTVHTFVFLASSWRRRTPPYFILSWSLQPTEPCATKGFSFFDTCSSFCQTMLNQWIPMWSVFKLNPLQTYTETRELRRTRHVHLNLREAAGQGAQCCTGDGVDHQSEAQVYTRVGSTSSIHSRVT